MKLTERPGAPFLIVKFTNIAWKVLAFSFPEKRKEYHSRSNWQTLLFILTDSPFEFPSAVGKPQKKTKWGEWDWKF